VILKDAEKLAKRLMKKFGLDFLRFRFTRSKIFIGYCSFLRYKKEWIPYRIELSSPFVLINSKEVIKETILHEIAHAVAGREHCHDEVWKECAVYVGADPFVVSCNVNVPEGRYKGICPICKKVYYKYRTGKLVRSSTFVCPRDKGEFKFKDTKKGKK